MKTTIIHHSADFDGLFCREIAKKFLPKAEIIGWDFKDKPIPVPDGQIYILDLPIDRPFGYSFGLTLDRDVKWLNNVFWIDHHKSSIDSHPTNVSGYRIDGVAACRLAWQYFFGHTPLPSKQDFIDRNVNEPYAVQLAGEYDIWDKRNPNAETFQFGLRSVGELNWKELLDDSIEETFQIQHSQIYSTKLLHNGIMLQRFQQDQDKSLMHRSYLAKFEGLTFLTLNTARCNSLTFSSMDVPETGHEALMGYYWDGKKYNVSMYHAKHRKDLDLSLIAVKHGGGGHKGACGFQTEKLQF